ncbi:hypothetical protein ABZ816_41805 [Actinosynnema sp. NPDC047251]|uniref:Uncharacterized protein n=1 Tax=Saccharothrix espanaensis (strain ATCC 51144 / DSM 44229 / JCM 9112 / NBRC 15066 / NRRL 15764) TaxID=1179773 RepID=K0JV82_SACES|nr:hypothetical protein [Saccharothrix espanaensis]CCH29417.1 hypothetical protein BN6_20960 [Saccharothrix espanaensis DSM 44229]
MSTEVVSASSVHDDHRRWCTGDSENQERREGTWRAGDLLVASASEVAQQVLEAELFSAVVRAMDGIRRRARPLRPTSLVRRTRADDGLLALEVADDGVDEVLSEVLPRLVGDRLVGIPGVRPLPGRHHLELRLSGTPAVVRLLGLDRPRWHEAAGPLAAGCVAVWRDVRDRWHEREHAAARAPRDLTAAAGSALLRRFPLWKGAAWLSTVARPGGCLEVYWRDGPRGEAVAAILSDSCCRVPDTAVTAYVMPTDGVRGVRLSPGRSVAHGGESGWAWTEWTAMTAPGPLVPEHAALAATETPSAILPQMWEQPSMREALARREIGDVYRLLAGHGVPLDHIGRATGQNIEEVSATLAGHPVRDYDRLCRIADGLGIPKGYMGLAHHERAAPVYRDCDCDEHGKRRRFLEHAAMLLIGSAESGTTVQSRNGFHDASCHYALSA